MSSNTDSAPESGWTEIDINCTKYRLRLDNGVPTKIEWYSNASDGWHKCTHYPSNVVLAVWYDRQSRHALESALREVVTELAQRSERTSRLNDDYNAGKTAAYEAAIEKLESLLSSTATPGNGSEEHSAAWESGWQTFFSEDSQCFYKSDTPEWEEWQRGWSAAWESCYGGEKPKAATPTSAASERESRLVEAALIAHDERLLRNCGIVKPMPDSRARQLTLVEGWDFLTELRAEVLAALDTTADGGGEGVTCVDCGEPGVTRQDEQKTVLCDDCCDARSDAESYRNHRP